MGHCGEEGVGGGAGLRGKLMCEFREIIAKTPGD